VFQVTDIDARNAVEKLVTEGVIDRHVQAVDGHGAFVEAIIFRDLRLCGTRKWIGRGGGGGGGGQGQ
jgi:DNA-binding GntR family transcriptional regulator